MKCDCVQCVPVITPVNMSDEVRELLQTRAIWWALLAIAVALA